MIGNKPLLICDADEVIFDFMRGFESFLLRNSLRYLWRSYSLTGNIVNKNNVPIDEKKVKVIIKKFLEECTSELSLVKCAKTSLIKLARHYQILVLSNIPFEFYEQRLKALEKRGLFFPFFANEGAKGKVCSYLFKNSKNPVWFIDDSPMQVNSVKKENSKIKTILYIENVKLAKLVKHNNITDYYSTSWASNEKILLN